MTPPQRSNHPEGPLRDRFREVGTVIRRRRTVLACVFALGIVASLVLLLDALNGFSPIREATAHAGCAVVLGLGLLDLLVQVGRAVLRGPSVQQMALRVEAVRPELMDSLICSVEVETRDPARRRPLERALLENVRTGVAELDFLSAVLPDRLRMSRLVSLGVVFALLAVSAWRSEIAAKARHHRADRLGGRSTGLLLSPGDQDLPVATDVTVAADVRRWENEAEIVYEDAEGVHRFLMNREGLSRHTFTLYAVAAPVRYRVLTPSLASPWHDISVYEPPSIRRAEIRLTPPAYTGLPAEVVPDLTDFSVVPGTSAEFALELSPGTTAVFRSGSLVRSFEPAPPAVAPPTQAGAQARAEPAPSRPHPVWHSADIRESFRYSVGLRSADGHAAETKEFAVECRADLPPMVQVLRPRRDVPALAKTIVGVSARATDDFGLQLVTVSYSVSGRGRAEALLFRAPAAAAGGPPRAGEGGPRVTDKTVEHVFDLASLEAEEGDVVSYFFKATDNRDPEPQTAKSDVFFIEVRTDLKTIEGDGKGLKMKKLNIRPLIAELKRLIRVTWDTLSSPPEQAEEQAQLLLRGMRDLHVEGRRTLQEMQQASPGAAADTAAGLLTEALAEIDKAVTLIERELVEESLVPQERGLARLITLENELIKNAVKGGRGGESQEQQSSEGKKPEDARQQEEPSSRDRLDAMAELTKQLRRLAGRQEGLNQQLGRPHQDQDEAARALAGSQEEIATDTRTAAAQLQRIPEAGRAGRETGSSAAAMASGGRSLREGSLQGGKRQGLRAHSLLLAALESLQEAYRKAAANEIMRLAQAAEALAENQRQAAEQSAALAGQPNPSEPQADKLLQNQQDLNQGAEALLAEANQTAAALEERFPKAAAAVSQAQQQAREGNVLGRMKRAANALLYRRFDRGRQSQTDAANLLQRLAGDLEAAAQQLPGISREEIAEALEKIRRAQQQVRRAQKEDSPDADQQLDRIREQSGTEIDRMAAALKDPNLSRLGDALALPMDNGPSGQGSQRLLSILSAAAQALEKHLFASEMKRRLSLARRSTTPPEKYRRLVEEYFKDLSESQ